MSETLYRVIDAMHGAVILLLLFYVLRFLIIRREGSLRVRHLAGLFMAISALQTLVGFLLEEEVSLSLSPTECLSLCLDLLVLLTGLGIGWILYRNRHLYGRRMVRVVWLLLLVQWFAYGLCALWQFVDWTGLVYLVVSGLVWGTIGWLIDSAVPNVSIPIPEDAQPEDSFLAELNSVLSHDRFFCSATVSRDEVCRRMLTNRTTFSHHLNEATGMTFSEYLREMRLREAARLLRETDIPIDQVAYEVGLRSASGFHRNFLLSYGKTPNQYRIDNRA